MIQFADTQHGLDSKRARSRNWRDHNHTQNMGHPLPGGPRTRYRVAAAAQLVAGRGGVAHTGTGKAGTDQTHSSNRRRDSLPSYGRTAGNRRALWLYESNQGSVAVAPR